MAGFKLKVRANANDVKEQAGGEWINKSGVFPITINFLSLSKSDNGAVSYAINYNYKDNDSTIYGPTIMNKDGSENEIGYRTLNKLFNIAGLDDGYEPETTEETHRVGKDNKEQSFQVLADLSDLEVQMKTKLEYGKYKGDIKERMNIDSFFRMDGASADELIMLNGGSEIQVGKQLEKILANPKTTEYKLGKDENKVAVTQAEVDAYLAAKSSGNSTTSNQQAAPAVVKPAKNLFAN